MGLLPTLYTTVRIHFIGNLPAAWGFNIASQLAWLNVAYEVIHEALLLPMFYLIGKHLSDRRHFAVVVSNGLLLTIVLYGVVSGFTIVFTRPLIVFMAQRSDLVDQTVTYIRLEAVALALFTVVRYLLLVLVTLKRSRYLLIVLAVQMVLSIALDALFFSPAPFSLGMGVTGIAVTNIVVNVVLLLLVVVIVTRQGVRMFSTDFALDFRWLKEWMVVGGLSGLESLVRNAAFILMVLRLVNVVEEQGTFWVTNNFIWGWLLIPVIALGELIKRDTAEDEEAVVTRTPAYFLLTGAVIVVWAVTIPVWDGFLRTIMGIGNPEAVYKLALFSIGFYVVFAFNNVVDSIFYGRGRTDLMLYQSLIVNVLIYGSAFLLYQGGFFSPTLRGIAALFGTGIALDSLITFIMFARFRRRVAVGA